MATTPAVHISRDRFHLAWDPAIDADRDRRQRRPGRVRPARRRRRPADADSTVEDSRRLDFDRRRPGQRADRRRRRGARRHPPDRPARVRAGRLGLDRERSRVRPAGRRVPGSGLGSRASPRSASGPSSCPASASRSSPFCGEIGVAPADGPRSTIPPDLHGGNMDTRHLTAGSTLFLPVFHAGARLSMGDGHAAQGDGEVCGTAIETPMRALVRLTVRKDLHLTGPEFLTRRTRSDARSAGATRPTASGRICYGAARDAVRRMIDWLGREHGIAADRRLHALQRRHRSPDQRDRRHAELRRHGALPAVDLRLTDAARGRRVGAPVSATEPARTRPRRRPPPMLADRLAGSATAGRSTATTPTTHPDADDGGAKLNGSAGGELHAEDRDGHAAEGGEEAGIIAMMPRTGTTMCLRTLNSLAPLAR